jgi:predicted outer membrane protein
MSLVLQCVKATLCLAVCSLTVSVSVLAQAPTPETPTALTTLDQKFVRNAAADGVLEVELGRLAQQRGGGGEVKRFGERMVQDHTRLNADLQRIAAARGVPLPAKLGREREAGMSRSASEAGLANHQGASHVSVAGLRPSCLRRSPDACGARRTPAAGHGAAPSAA